VAACDTAKMILFYRSLQPNKQTRHIDIKHFAVLDWVKQDLLILKAISTHDNAAETMTKTLTKQLFYHHYDTYMRIRIPDYCALSNTSFQQIAH
jgi:hypothetical protein